MTNVIFVGDRRIGRAHKPSYKSPKGTFPSGTVAAKTVKVDMAVGMYQFHDLMASYEPYNASIEINDNPQPYIGLLNM